MSKKKNFVPGLPIIEKVFQEICKKSLTIRMNGFKNGYKFESIALMVGSKSLYCFVMGELLSDNKKTEKEKIIFRLILKKGQENTMDGLINMIYAKLNLDNKNARIIMRGKSTSPIEYYGRKNLKVSRKILKDSLDANKHVDLKDKVFKVHEDVVARMILKHLLPAK